MERRHFIIADPSYIVRKGMITVLNKLFSDFNILEAGDKEGLHAMLKEVKEGVLFLGPGMLDALEKKTSSLSNLPVILMGNHHEECPDGFQLLGHLPVDLPKEELLDRLREYLLQEKEKIPAPANEGLSEREKEVLVMVAKGFTNKEIADKLFLSAHTVITHRKNITRKLDIKTIPGLTVYAIINGLVGLQELS